VGIARCPDEDRDPGGRRTCTHAAFCGTATARIGYAYWDRILVYAEGGAAIAQDWAENSCNTASQPTIPGAGLTGCPSQSDSKVTAGWTGRLGFRVWADAKCVGEERKHVLRSWERPLQHSRHSDRHTKERIHLDGRTSRPLRCIVNARARLQREERPRRSRIESPRRPRCISAAATPA
jgi:hypothetical protein